MPSTHHVTLPGRLQAGLLEQARGLIDITLSEEVLSGLKQSQAFVESFVAAGNEVYGATTGFGPLVTFAGRDTAADQCDNTLQHLTAGRERICPRRSCAPPCWSGCGR